MKRILQAAVSAFIISALCLVTVCSVSPVYTVSSAYASSSYYASLQSTPLTGDYRNDLLAVAVSQLGYHEGNSVSELGGRNTYGTGNYSEYGYYFGKETMGNSGWFYEWCAMFVTWCARQAKIPVSVLSNAAYARADGSGSTGASSRFHIDTFSPSVYTPVPGDLIFFDWSGSKSQWNHVGIVEKVQNGFVHTIEGNSDNRVTRRSYPVSSVVIQAYGIMNGLSDIPYTDIYPVPERVIYNGSTGDDCKWLQAALNRLGESLEVDGIIGPLTVAAVKRFEQANGLYSDGIAGLSDIAVIKRMVDASYAVKGDINQNGRTEAADYLILREHILGIRALDGVPLILADINGDKSINSADYIALRRMILAAN